MADLGGEFDTTIHVAAKFDPIPEGDYELMVTESEMKPTKAGDGKILSCKIVVVSGPLAKRSLLGIFNWENKNPKAVQIGKGEFSDLCKAVGVPKPRDSQQIHNLPFIGKVVIDGDYNKIKKYAAKAVPQTVAAVASAPAGSVPWGK